MTDETAIHLSSLQEYFYKLYKTETLCDLSLKTKTGTTVLAHKLVVAAFSGVVRTEVEKLENALQVYITVDCEDLVLREILEFIYTGKIGSNEEFFPLLENASRTLQLISLQNYFKKTYPLSERLERKRLLTNNSIFTPGHLLSNNTQSSIGNPLSPNRITFSSNEENEYTVILNDDVLQNIKEEIISVEGELVNCTVIYDLDEDIKRESTLTCGEGLLDNRHVIYNVDGTSDNENESSPSTNDSTNNSREDSHFLREQKTILSYYQENEKDSDWSDVDLGNFSDDESQEETQRMESENCQKENSQPIDVHMLKEAYVLLERIDTTNERLLSGVNSVQNKTQNKESNNCKNSKEDNSNSKPRCQSNRKQENNDMIYGTNQKEKRYTKSNLSKLRNGDNHFQNKEPSFSISKPSSRECIKRKSAVLRLNMTSTPSKLNVKVNSNSEDLEWDKELRDKVTSLKDSTIEQERTIEKIKKMISQKRCFLCHKDYTYKHIRGLATHLIESHKYSSKETQKLTGYPKYFSIDTPTKPVCTECNEEFVNLCDYRFHCRFVHKKKQLDPDIPCTQNGCAQKFRNMRLLKRHLVNIHQIKDVNKLSFVQRDQLQHLNDSKLSKEAGNIESLKEGHSNDISHKDKTTTESSVISHQSKRYTKTNLNRLSQIKQETNVSQKKLPAFLIPKGCLQKVKKSLMEYHKKKTVVSRAGKISKYYKKQQFSSKNNLSGYSCKAVKNGKQPSSNIKEQNKRKTLSIEKIFGRKISSMKNRRVKRKRNVEKIKKMISQKRCFLCHKDYTYKHIRGLATHLIESHKYSSKETQKLTGYPKYFSIDTPTKPVCTECNEEFVNLCDYRFHCRFVHKKKQLDPDIPCTQNGCGQKFRNMRLLKTHLKNIHQIKDVYKLSFVHRDQLQHLNDSKLSKEAGNIESLKEGHSNDMSHKDKTTTESSVISHQSKRYTKTNLNRLSQIKQETNVSKKKQPAFLIPKGCLQKVKKSLMEYHKKKTVVSRAGKISKYYKKQQFSSKNNLSEYSCKTVKNGKQPSSNIKEQNKRKTLNFKKIFGRKISSMKDRRVKRKRNVEKIKKMISQKRCFLCHKDYTYKHIRGLATHLIESHKYTPTETQRLTGYPQFFSGHSRKTLKGSRYDEQKEPNSCKNVQLYKTKKKRNVELLSFGQTSTNMAMDDYQVDGRKTIPLCSGKKKTIPLLSGKKKTSKIHNDAINLRKRYTRENLKRLSLMKPRKNIEKKRPTFSLPKMFLGNVKRSMNERNKKRSVRYKAWTISKHYKDLQFAVQVHPFGYTCKVCKYWNKLSSVVKLHAQKHRKDLIAFRRSKGIFGSKEFKIMKRQRKIEKFKKKAANLQCYVCNKKYKQIRNLVTHLIEKHGYTSAITQKLIGYPSYFKVNTHSKPVCHECNKEFINLFDYRIHCRSVHKKRRLDPDIACTQEGCEEKFRNLHMLKTHLTEVHNIENAENMTFRDVFIKPKESKLHKQRLINQDHQRGNIKRNREETKSNTVIITSDISNGKKLYTKNGKKLYLPSKTYKCNHCVKPTMFHHKMIHKNHEEINHQMNFVSDQFKCQMIIKKCLHSNIISSKDFSKISFDSGSDLTTLQNKAADQKCMKIAEIRESCLHTNILVGNNIQKQQEDVGTEVSVGNDIQKQQEDVGTEVSVGNDIQKQQEDVGTEVSVGNNKQKQQEDAETEGGMKFDTSVDQIVTTQSLSKKIINLENPQKNMAEKKSYICSKCGFSYPLYSQLRLHITSKHGKCKLKQRQITAKMVKHVTVRQKVFSRKPRSHKVKPEGKYVCDICNKAFSRISYLEKHLEMTHQYVVEQNAPITHKSSLKKRKSLSIPKSRRTKERVYCTECPSSFTEIRSYANHLQTAHKYTFERAREVTGYPSFSLKYNINVKVRKCEKCSETFQLLKDYKRHRVHAHGVLCQYCDKKFGNGYLLKCHGMREHLNHFDEFKSMKLKNSDFYSRENEEDAEELEEVYDCEKCDFTSNKKTCLISHVIENHPEIQHSCPVCGKTFNMKIMLENHIVQNHGKGGKRKKIPCAVCDKRYFHMKHMLVHQLKVHDINHPSLKEYKCDHDGCNKIYYDVNRLKKHKKVHSGLDPINCTKCDFVCFHGSTLHRHKQRVHMNIHVPAVKPVLCDICGKGYSTNSHLKVHKMLAHSNADRIPCPYCSFKSLQRTILWNHVWRQHNIRMPDDQRQMFKCDQCAYENPVMSCLRKHLNTHKTTRDFLCDQCDSAFRTAATLMTHQKWKHSSEDLGCPHCNYKTKTNSRLNEHIRTQHLMKNVKPYQCVYCDFECATSGNCRKHIMGRHKGLPVKYNKNLKLSMGTQTH